MRQMPTTPVGSATLEVVTAKEQLLAEAPGWTEAQAKAALRAVQREAGDPDRPVGEQIADGYRRVPQTPEEDAWAAASAREAIREEPW